VFLTNNFTYSSEIIAHLYKERWKIELFFKWIKHHLRIKKFYGTSFNAVSTQIWISVSIYLTRSNNKEMAEIGTRTLHNSTDF